MRRTLRLHLARLRAALRRDRLDDELREEIEQHIDLRRRQLIEDGMDPREAAFDARRSFGNATSFREETRAMWSFPSIDTMLQDVRYGARLLRRSPTFAVVAILSLAIGIGSAAAVFSLFDAVLFRKLPVKDPDALVILQWRNQGRMPFESLSGNWNSNGASGAMSTSFSLATFEALRDEAAGSAAVIGFAGTLSVNVGIDERAEAGTAAVVSGNYFDVLGVAPAAGRLLVPSDDHSDAAPAAVISHAIWQRRFGSAQDAVGRTITVNAVPITIVGVAPKGFRGTLQVNDAPDVMMPLALRASIERSAAYRSPSYWWVLLMARLGPGLEPATAQPRLEESVRRSVANGNASLSIADLPHLELLPGARGQREVRSGLWEPLRFMAFVIAIVLLVTCANVANLLLARGRARAREVALRVAIGARRSRVVRQLLTEGVLLAVIGSALGLLVARWIADALMPALSRLSAASGVDVGPDWRVVVFTALLTSLVSILFGLVPALRSTDVRLAHTLQEHGRTVTGGRRRLSLSAALVVVQVGLSVVLVTAAGLLVHSARNLLGVNPGFDPASTLLLRIDPGRNGYTPARTLELYSAALERLSAIPGVRSASFSSSTLISGGGSSTMAALPDAPPLEPGTVEARKFAQSHQASRLVVDENFFSTMGIPMLRGRTFAAADGADAPSTGSGQAPRAAVVNRALALQLFGQVDVVGRQFKSELRPNAPLYEIAGVCADAKYTSMRGNSPPTMYLFYRQRPPGPMTFALKTLIDPLDIAAAARDVIRRLDPDLPVFDVRTQEEQIRRSLQRDLVFAKLAVLLSGLTLVLSGIGLYGLLAYTVTRRTPEIGVRMALGADRSSVRWMIIRQSLLLVAAGVVLGIPAALGAGRFVESMLFGLTPTNPIAMVTAIGVMVGVSLLAAFIPAHRASRVDPMVALRTE